MLDIKADNWLVKLFTPINKLAIIDPQDIFRWCLVNGQRATEKSPKILYANRSTFGDDTTFCLSLVRALAESKLSAGLL